MPNAPNTMDKFHSIEEVALMLGQCAPKNLIVEQPVKEVSIWGRETRETTGKALFRDSTLTTLERVESHLKQFCHRLICPDYLRRSLAMVQHIIERIEAEAKLVPAPMHWDQEKLKKLREYLPENLFDKLFIACDDNTYRERSADAIKYFLEFGHPTNAVTVEWCMDPAGKD